MIRMPGVGEYLVSCGQCGTRNKMHVFNPHQLAVCGKCGWPLEKKTPSRLIRVIGSPRPRKPRGVCGCCLQKPQPGEKLHRGFCPDCWAGQDGMGPPPNRWRTRHLFAKK